MPGYFSRTLQRTGKAVALAAGLSLPLSATATNLYTAGSVPAQMYDVVKPVLGDVVTPFFILGNNPSGLIKSLDPIAMQQAGIHEDTIAYYLAHLQTESFKYGVEGYALGGYGVPGNEQASRTCAIILASPAQMRSTSTMFHEAIHCRNFAELRVDHNAWVLAVSMNQPWLGMSDNQFMSLFHEVLAAYIQVAHYANYGRSDGLAMVMRASRVNVNTATSIGYRTARNALKRCSVKDHCSVHAADIVSLLANNPSERADMLLDLKELHEAAQASGYVVENK